MANNYNFTDTELQTPVQNMGLSVRATNALRGAWIETLADLIGIVESGELLNLRNIGKLGVQEIMNKLAEMQTQKYRDHTAAIRELEQKSADVQHKIDEHNAIIQQLNKQQTFYQTQIKTLKKGY